MKQFIFMLLLKMKRISYVNREKTLLEGTDTLEMEI